ncbi:cytidylyltransferase domain-containing protein [Dyadobacter sp. CY323]|uniref:acylneuraminate cytidylyltransferase family protein n=1 Tax=Dyadobacter sp. CY323 TaxID=2907302 RepID=UPI001F22BD94|nr:acylneuraminate cytidylyltransferase family protein [Dyadobacter sp. CY323]MCE6988669.1 acylneuraminate cytidylyltransferase family protein [Dyadobacter sp. CY323]
MAGFPIILALIPARAGSKGVPGKNMKQLGGKPLIAYTIESALHSEMLARIVVSTNCMETIRFVNGFPRIETPFVRPDAISRDETPMQEVVLHALEYFADQGIQFEYVLLLQPTTPFRTVDLIDRAIQKIIESESDSLVTIQKIPDKYNPYWAFEYQNDTLITPVIPDKRLTSRRQDLPETYYRDGRIYISKTSLIKQGTFLGGKIYGMLTNEIDINIDTLEDWKKAEMYVKE